ncbi:hypothetical protein PI125_g16425 [Phytophthora idaei]|nr:hypothetical protein PI125_g16425 [Phytophthora idaei]
MQCVFLCPLHDGVGRHNSNRVSKVRLAVGDNPESTAPVGARLAARSTLFDVLFVRNCFTPLHFATVRVDLLRGVDRRPLDHVGVRLGRLPSPCGLQQTRTDTAVLYPFRAVALLASLGTVRLYHHWFAKAWGQLVRSVPVSASFVTRPPQPSPSILRSSTQIAK